MLVQAKEVPRQAAQWAAEFEGEQRATGPSLGGDEFASFQGGQHPAAQRWIDEFGGAGGYCKSASGYCKGAGGWCKDTDGYCNSGLMCLAAQVGAGAGHWLLLQGVAAALRALQAHFRAGGLARLGACLPTRLRTLYPPPPAGPPLSHRAAMPAEAGAGPDWATEFAEGVAGGGWVEDFEAEAAGLRSTNVEAWEEEYLQELERLHSAAGAPLA